MTLREIRDRGAAAARRVEARLLRLALRDGVTAAAAELEADPQTVRRAARALGVTWRDARGRPRNATRNP